MHKLYPVAICLPSGKSCLLAKMRMMASLISRSLMILLKTLHSAYFTLHTAYLTLHTSYFTLHTAYLTLQTAYLSLHTAYFTLQTAYLTLHTAYLTLHTAYLTAEILPQTSSPKGTFPHASKLASLNESWPASGLRLNYFLETYLSNIGNARKGN